jgi:hypothetical protein
MFQNHDEGKYYASLDIYPNISKIFLLVFEWKRWFVFWKSLFSKTEKTSLKIIVAFHPKYEWILT